MPSPGLSRATRVIATKKPQQYRSSSDGSLPITELLSSRPWLKRQQSISEQDFFIIICRGNLVAGATGPKDWDSVTREFNEAFKDKLRKPLAWKTISGRCRAARKIFLSENQEYEYLVRYPVPDFDNQSEADELMDGFEIMDADRDLPTTKSTHLLTGYYDPFSTMEQSITALTGAKFHLACRTVSPVNFCFLDPHQRSLAKENSQSVDMSVLKFNSSYYARTLHQGQNLTIIDVPENFSIRTINIFIQLIAPVCAIHLPQHYLWKNKKVSLGELDRFGGVQAEKIIWAIDVLFELMSFAQILRVSWIVDMIIDRLYFLVIQQKKHDTDFGQVSTSKGKDKERYVPGDPRLPIVDAQLTRLPTEDFGEELFEHLANVDIDIPALRFTADLLSALGGRVNAKWVNGTSNEVKSIITHTAAEHLTNSTLDVFCKRYHHHASAPDACYTSYTGPISTKIINALYCTVTDTDQSTSHEMMVVEKMVLEMENRLEKTKAALKLARDASQLDKTIAIYEASKAAKELYRPSDF